MKSHLAALLLALSPGGAWAACALPSGAGSPVDDGVVALAWRPERGAIAAGQPFALVVTLCPAQARLVAVDATMPEHRHGMNYRPSVQPLGGGRWRVQGLLWHMSGRWELRFDVDQDGEATRALRQSYVLP